MALESLEEELAANMDELRERLQPEFDLYDRLGTATEPSLHLPVNLVTYLLMMGCPLSAPDAPA